MWINGDGYIAFDTPSYLGCNDRAAASEVPLVAPLFGPRFATAAVDKQTKTILQYRWSGFGDDTLGCGNGRIREPVTSRLCSMKMAGCCFNTAPATQIWLTARFLDAALRRL